MAWKNSVKQGIHGIMISLAVLAGADRVVDRDIFDIRVVPRRALTGSEVFAGTRSGHIDQSSRMMVKESAFTEQTLLHFEGEAAGITPTQWKSVLTATKLLGTGQFGTVYEEQVKCSTTSNEAKTVAMKVVSIADPHLEGEIQALQKINSLTRSNDSPYLYRLIGLLRDEQEKKVYMLTPAYNSDMLYAAARYPLGGAGKRAPFLTWPQRLALFLDIVKGIRELHSADIVHADLKPENVMINCDQRCVDIRLSKKPEAEKECNLSDRSCVAVVIDVGLAVNAGDFDELRGTPQFISKEIIKAAQAGRKPQYQKSVDIFALGALLYELRTDGSLIPDCRGENCRVATTLAYKPSKISGVGTNLKYLIGNMTLDEPTSRPSIDTMVSEVDKLLKETVSQDVYAKAVQDPNERGALQALPACLKI
jgi:serine/threonine protein kinase